MIEAVGIALTIALVVVLLAREAVDAGAVRAAGRTRVVATAVIAVLAASFVAVVVQRIVELT